MHEPLAPRDFTSHPAYAHDPYRSTALRAPTQAAIRVPQTGTERTGPSVPHNAVGAAEADLTTAHRKNGEPLGERIIVAGRVLDEAGRPVPNTMVEIWQANAAGRYIHENDRHDAPPSRIRRHDGRARSDRRLPRLRLDPAPLDRQPVGVVAEVLRQVLHRLCSPTRMVVHVLDHHCGRWASGRLALGVEQ